MRYHHSACTTPALPTSKLASSESHLCAYVSKKFAMLKKEVMKKNITRRTQILQDSGIRLHIPEYYCLLVEVKYNLVRILLLWCCIHQHSINICERSVV
jgi:hypothetical protein